MPALSVKVGRGATGLEAGLFKMVVGRQSAADAAPRHDDEGNAVGQGPFLVGPLGVQV
jgi:hypothetical protein